MAGASNIEWTERVWNPVAGCQIVSPGCTNCYAMKMANRLGANPKTPIYHGLTRIVNGKAVWTGEFRFVENAIRAPMKVKKPTVWFVNSMSDLFGEGVEDAWIYRVFAIMALTPHHTYQILTKRPERMREVVSTMTFEKMAEATPRGTLPITWADMARALGLWPKFSYDPPTPAWPLPNVWLGTSTEDQRRFDKRWPNLEATAAAVRFISYEPALGPVRLGAARPDWLIFGDESGPGRRPADEAWARDIRDDCLAAGTDFYLKQRIIGGEKVSLPRLDSVVHDARPAVRA